MGLFQALEYLAVSATVLKILHVPQAKQSVRGHFGPAGHSMRRDRTTVAC